MWVWARQLVTPLSLSVTTSWYGPAREDDMNRFLTCIMATLFFFVACKGLSAKEVRVRVATYNAQWMDGDYSKEGDRLTHLREVIRRLDANVAGLQEVADRQALEQVFDPQQWSLLIDDDSSDRQDLALAVRRPLVFTTSEGRWRRDLNASDADFLFTGKAFESAFPNRRDVLFADIRMPGESWAVRVLVHHAKSRRDGRATTETRRIEAAQMILKELKRLPAGTLFILLGDFNDTADDQSLNILESGDANAAAEMENKVGPFLVNLTEPLIAANHVSQGRSSRDIRNGKVNTVDPGSREVNFRTRGKNEKGRWDFLPDQILMPVTMLIYCPQRSACIFDDAVAVEGDNRSRASDHLPVYVDLILGKK